jgi:hypothetical protein
MVLSSRVIVGSIKSFKCVQYSFRNKIALSEGRHPQNGTRFVSRLLHVTATPLASPHTSLIHFMSASAQDYLAKQLFVENNIVSISSHYLTSYLHLLIVIQVTYRSLSRALSIHVKTAREYGFIPATLVCLCNNMKSTMSESLSGSTRPSVPNLMQHI